MKSQPDKFNFKLFHVYIWVLENKCGHICHSTHWIFLAICGTKPDDNMLSGRLKMNTAKNAY